MMARVRVRAPFHLEATVRVLQRRPSNLVDRWERERYRRAIRVGHELALIEVRDRGTVDSPDVKITVRGRKLSRHARAAAVRTGCEILGLDFDIALPRRRIEAEPALRDVAAALRGMRPPRYPDLFETFANVIPFQQLSLAAGMAVTAKIVRRFGESLKVDGAGFHVFPNAEIIATGKISALRGCGMSTRKAESLRSVARAIASGELASETIAAMSSKEAIDQLSQLPGIGHWSAALILLRGFRRMDVFPQADTGAQGGLAALFRLRSTATLPRIVYRFGDARGYLYFYALASRLLSAGLIRSAGPAQATRGQ